MFDSPHRRHQGLLLMLALCMHPYLRANEVKGRDLAGVEGPPAMRNGGSVILIDRVDVGAPEPAVWDAAEHRCGTADLALAPDPEELSPTDGYGAHPALHGVDTEPVEVDVMILYTSEARALLGRSRVLEAIQLSVACANEAFRRSEIAVALRLVHQGEAVDHRESGRMGDALAWLRHDPTVKALRTEHGADLVSLIVARGDYAGIAACSGSFSVYSGRPFIFAHELGHNFGGSHDRGQPAVCRRDLFSFAHVFETPDGDGVSYGTLMSYMGSSILNFSNPDVRFRDAPTGVPEGARDADGKDVSADNGRTIRTMAREIAARKPTRFHRLGEPKLDPSGKTFSFELVARARETYSVQYTADFIRWSALGYYDTDGVATVTDEVATVPARFYRAVPGSGMEPRPLGFYRRAVPAGRSLIANQLDNGDNRVARLFADLPVGSVLHKWEGGIGQWVSNTLLAEGWTEPAMRLHPGEGAMLELESPMVLTFVGQVRPAVFQPVERGLISSPVPREGHLGAALGWPEAGVEDQWVGLGEAFWSDPSTAYVWQRLLLPLSQPSTAMPALELPAAESGAVWRVEWSLDLMTWSPLATVISEGGPVRWNDPETGLWDRRFFRAVLMEP